EHRNTQFGHDWTIPFLHEGPATQGDHTCGPILERSQVTSFDPSKCWLSVLLKDLTNRLALLPFNLSVKIDKVPPQFCSHQRPHGRLSGSHEPNQEDLISGHFRRDLRLGHHSGTHCAAETKKAQEDLGFGGTLLKQ